MDFIVLRQWEGVIRGSVATLREGAIIDAGHYDVPALKASGLRVAAFSAALAALVAQEDGTPGDAVAAAVVDADDRLAAVSIPVFAGGATGIVNSGFFTTNGTAAETPAGSAGAFSESIAGMVGTLTGFGWNKESPALDTVMNVVVDGAMVEAVTLSLGLTGFLPLTVGAPITAQSRIAVQKASGTDPLGMTVKVFAGV